MSSNGERMISGESASPRLTAPLPAMSAPPPIQCPVDIHIANVSGQFNLSLAENFEAAHSLVAISKAGLHATLKKGQLIMEFWHHRGNATVGLNGLVMLRGQKSFDEIRRISNEVYMRYRAFAHQDVGVHKLLFTNVIARAYLPFEINLNRFHRNNQKYVQYNPEIHAGFADVHYKDLGVSVAVPGSGKLGVYGKGDCNPPDDNHSNLLEAINRIIRMAYPARMGDANNDRPSVWPVGDCPSGSSVPKPPTPLRRSKRLLNMKLDDMDDEDGSPRKNPNEDDYLPLDNLELTPDERFAAERFNEDILLYGKDKVALHRVFESFDPSEQPFMVTLRQKLMKAGHLERLEVLSVPAPFVFPTDIKRRTFATAKQAKTKDVEKRAKVQRRCSGKAPAQNSSLSPAKPNNFGNSPALSLPSSVEPDKQAAFEVIYGLFKQMDE